ncbi:hypothetical protein FQA39_LY10769 [Lamprigera yunnana]|nr:hypothetical protein FQA39_LY10769 [Lamprigera yunnana]
MVKMKKFILVKNFKNLPKESDFRLVEEELPEIKTGEFLAEAVYLSLDPYMRVHKIKEGETMVGYQVAKIIKSNNKDFPVDKYIVGNFGWQTYTISNDDTLPYPSIITDIGDLPLSLTLGMLGATGNAAYSGILEICKPASGETIVISSAAGAIGSHAGQIAKIKGCRVIGITGSQEKCNWLRSIGFDVAINYKNKDWRNSLIEAVPRGIDCYFDNVRGEISSIVIQHMSQYGRVAVCGSISSYNCDIGQLPQATIIQPWIVYHQLEIKGFLNSHLRSRWNESIKQNLEWIKEGKLQYKETTFEGFENMPRAFISLFSGENTGKVNVKV